MDEDLGTASKMLDDKVRAEQVQAFLKQKRAEQKLLDQKLAEKRRLAQQQAKQKHEDQVLARQTFVEYWFSQERFLDPNPTTQTQAQIQDV